MPVTHEPWLVALSVLLAIQGAYVGLSLAVQTGRAIGAQRRVLLAAASISLAVAIWAMHFVGMLAARLPFAVDYLVFPTLLSFLVCVLVVGIAVFAVTAGPLTAGRLAASAVFMGLGIVSMHYIGMTALHASAHMVHAQLFVVASVVIAIAASALALRLAVARSAGPTLPLSAAALGIAISGMHYTAMAGVTIFPHDNPMSSAPALSPDLLAIVVAVVAFIVSGVFLLVLVPDRNARQSVVATAPMPNSPVSGFSAEPDPLVPAATSGIATVGPAEVTAVVEPHAAAGRLPVERDGGIYLLPIDRIVAVRANAHYTYVFDGAATYFCSLAISDVESRLDSARFIRVHRSHIVNLDHIRSLKRAGDNGQIELNAHDSYVVPVSRSKMAWLKTHLALKAPHQGSAVHSAGA